MALWRKTSPLLASIIYQKNRNKMKKLNKISQLAVAAIGLSFSVAADANAAALQGRVGINPLTIPSSGVQAGVNIIGSGLTLGDIDPTVTGAEADFPVTSFDFVPPENTDTPTTGGTTGSIFELNANPENGFNDFLPFVTQIGAIQDLSLNEIIAINTGTPLDDFIVIPNAFSFQLTQVNAPTYDFDGGGTTVSIGVAGNFFNLNDGSNDISSGVGTFSVDFGGLTPEQTRELFDEAGELPAGFTPATWSSNFVALAPAAPTTPEASNLLGLLVLGLGGALTLKGRKLQ